jgi:hypothetical protein
MQERTKRLAIAILLTVGDVVTFSSYSGVIWQTWGQDPWVKAALLGLLAFWIVSAVVLWIHVSYHLRQTLHERDLALARAPAMARRGLRRDGDV